VVVAGGSAVVVGGVGTSVERNGKTALAHTTMGHQLIWAGPLSVRGHTSIMSVTQYWVTGHNMNGPVTHNTNSHFNNNGHTHTGS